MINYFTARAAALILAAVATATLAGCASTADATPAGRITAPATVQVTPTISPTEQQDRAYYRCAAPIFGVYVDYDTARASSPDGLAKVIASGRSLYTTFAALPAGTSVDVAAVAAGLDDNGTATLRCAVEAFEGVTS
ncbi:hypothetical protein ACPXB3_22125 [Gordonia sp. DT219]|uniref:hypothetical protein n=1 Tax=Gordonia sp. DT219 TaxID=3416658 RepID=UPI003CE70E0D